MLDARNDEVNVTKARAQLAKDQAALADAERQLARSKDLFAQNFISQGAVDTNQTLVDSARAVVAADRAAIESAQVGLSYSRIVAPAAGRAGAINVFPGSIGAAGRQRAGDDHPARPDRGLASACRSATSAMRWRRLRGGGGKVTAVLPDGAGTVTGKLKFVDNAVDAASGTVRVKARVREQERAAVAGRVRHRPARGADARRAPA